MKRAGIVTLFGEYNFGNRLQNYAVQEILKKVGLDVKTIKYVGVNDYIPENDSEIKENRLKKFKEFNNHIKFAKDILYKEYEPKKCFSEDYDYIVLGSDQIWNFTFKNIFSDKAFGSFVPGDKRISLSASFGVSNSPEEGSALYNMCKENLENIKAISVREEAGKEIVKKITGRSDVEVLIDPTMMLEKEEWEKLMIKPEKLKTDKFIIKSFIGDVPKEVNNEINEMARKLNCEVIDISDQESNFYDMGPAEFIYLTKNASMVATDSFHSCVFSILFSTPFIVFERQGNLEDMYSRIDTLLDKFNLKHRIFKDKITDDLFIEEYSNKEKILNKERKKVLEFLNKALA